MNLEITKCIGNKNKFVVIIGERLMFYNAKNDVLEYENTTVDYISFGEGKEDLIFIPGLGEGLNSISGYAVPFSLMYKVYAKDYRVHVFSRRKEMPEDFSTEDMANDIIKHMEELNIEKAHIVGVSQGGMIAEHIAINAPEKVNKLVLVVTVARKTEEAANDLYYIRKELENR